MSDSELPAVPEKLRRWLEWTLEVEASDLHLVVGYPPSGSDARSPHSVVGGHH